MYSHFASNAWVTPFGLIFIAAIFVAWFFARRNASSTYIDPSHIDLLMPVTIIVGVAGGTLIAMLMPADQMVAGEAMNHGIRLRLFQCWCQTGDQFVGREYISDCLLDVCSLTAIPTPHAL